MAWNDNNQASREQQKLEEARRLWEESETVLNILRCETGTHLPEVTDKQIFEWERKIRKTSR